MTVRDLEAAHARVLTALHGAGPATPAGLRLRIDALSPRQARRPLVPALAAAAAVACLAVVVLVAVSSQRPPATELARLATQPATAPAPAVDTSRPALLEREFAGVDYPNWTTEFGWMASGTRRDRVAGRDADTVFYLHTHHRISYTIVAGPPLSPPAGADSVVIDGVTIHRFRDGPRDVVTFERGGRTCVLSGEVHNPATLLKLAAWRGGGDVRFS